MAYIGSGMEEVDKTIATINMVCNTMVGDGSTATMEIGTTQAVPGSVNNVSIYYDGVMQRPTTDYTLSYKTVTFTTAPENLVNVVCLSYANAFPSTVSDSTVYGSGIEDNAITDAKIASLISSSKLTGALPAIDGSALTGVSAEEITKSSSDPTISINPAGGVGTVWANTATGEMYICIDATTNANVWTNVGDGTGNVPEPVSLASGGTLTTDGDYNVHTFNSSDPLTFSVADAPVEYLVIGGGGGSGGDLGGGAGAGAYRTATGFAVTAQAYTVTVGAGGAAGALDGNAGVDSVFSSITSAGGGKGGEGGVDGGNSAGSGGGGGDGGAAGTGGSYGNDGGFGPGNGGGGGGGASTAGGNQISGSGGTGGTGTASSITGSAVTRAGGGGGGAYYNDGSSTQGLAGAGGGGNGNALRGDTGNAGTANTGGGAGGGGWNDINGGAGGSGVVIIRYRAR